MRNLYVMVVDTGNMEPAVAWHICRSKTLWAMEVHAKPLGYNEAPKVLLNITACCTKDVIIVAS